MVARADAGLLCLVAMSDARLLQIAIADGSPAFLTAAANYVADLPGYVLAGTADTALQALTLVSSAGPDVLLLDLGRRRCAALRW